MINIHKDLRKNGMNVPKIILNKENNGYTSLDDGKYCVIYSFLDGDEIGNLFKNINAEVSSKIAKEIKKIHKISNHMVCVFLGIDFLCNPIYDKLDFAVVPSWKP